MRKLTKRQRLAAYRYALANFQEGNGWGICNWLRSYLSEKLSTGYVHISYIPDLFHEFKLFKPKRDNVYWFDSNKQRMICLEFCIQMILNPQK